MCVKFAFGIKKNSFEIRHSYQMATGEVEITGYCLLCLGLFLLLLTLPSK